MEVEVEVKVAINGNGMFKGGRMGKASGSGGELLECTKAEHNDVEGKKKDSNTDEKWGDRQEMVLNNRERK